MIVRVYQVIDVEITGDREQMWKDHADHEDCVMKDAIDIELYQTALNEFAKSRVGDRLPQSNVEYGSNRFVYFESKEDAGDPTDVEIRI